MAKNNNEWTLKVMALLKAGNAQAAIGQIKVAPTVGDLRRLQAALLAPGAPRLKNVDEVVADQIVALSAPRLHRSP
ncbi:hypothetical protein PSQ20_10420 [Curvibacter sp. RS43]|jgi:hypothetical protein|uniref:Uncharacterized protein n=2 Tax=Curvibacter TaxID=281915 RepID=A0ABT5N0I3_9BURK|nr:MULTISPECIES: hypothetical protein [unclassified Curvibacter]MDD0810752.1 hypothetical protein [Curvibacter sp. RS43]MDD0815513.1 hypothetical protein [Curvibacter sp. HBC28]MDD0838552.1 hypothetical protein [Curvibacter sp. HBC61]